jgi:hypothetical protein
MTALSYNRFETPVGQVVLLGQSGALTGMVVADQEATFAVADGWVEDDRAFRLVRDQLGQYFDGTRTLFDPGERRIIADSRRPSNHGLRSTADVRATTR